jgi:hypothetical protein
LTLPDDYSKIDYDLETIPLEIKTDSVLGSKDKVRVDFTDSGDTNSGGFAILFQPPRTMYFVRTCSNSSFIQFPTSLPAAKDKVWRLTLTRTSGIRLIIHCNEEELLNVLMSDSTCSDKDWSNNWNRKVTKIWFDSSDTATDFYRPTGKINQEIIAKKGDS